MDLYDSSFDPESNQKEVQGCATSLGLLLTVIVSEQKHGSWWVHGYNSYSSRTEYATVRTGDQRGTRRNDSL
jgi:hypothetical protein